MTPLPAGLQQSQQSFLMPPSPSRGRRSSTDYRPSIRKALGHVPACLVNASVTYCNDDQIYAFGGFDQYTDEGMPFLPLCVRCSGSDHHPSRVLVYNHVLRLNLSTLRWELVDNYGDIPGVRMGSSLHPEFPLLVG